MGFIFVLSFGDFFCGSRGDSHVMGAWSQIGCFCVSTGCDDSILSG